MRRDAVEKAFEEADARRLLDVAAVGAVLASGNGHHGAGVLRSVLAGYEEPPLTRSELESRFLALCEAAGIPTPAVNARVAVHRRRLEVDFLWRAERLVVETDGPRRHGTRAAFERDRRRDGDLLVAGYRVVRFTWRQVVDDPRYVCATLVALLGGSPAGVSRPAVG